ncbi:MAG: TIGR02679 domain-containing protein [Chordicoccus sp.]
METDENVEKRATRACFEYLERGSIFRKMLDGFVEKYRSYGEVCGSVRLRLENPDSVDLLEGFLGRSLRGRKSVTISADALHRVIASSRFAGADLEQILFLYAGGPIPVRKEMKSRRQELYRTILQDVVRQSADPVMRRLAGELYALTAPMSEIMRPGEENSPADYTEAVQPAEERTKALAGILVKRFGIAWSEGGEEAAAAALSGCLALTAAILEHLPVRHGVSRYLAVFASDVTGNPHSFDRGAENGPLAEAVLRWYVETYHPPVASFSIPDSLKAVRRGQLFLRCGIMIDDVSNYVTVYGIRAMRRGGREDQGLRGFWEERAAVHVPLATVMEWTEMQPARILIVENPSIFSMLISRFPDEAFMCVNGQPNLAALVALHLLAESGSELWYGGDMDPEGLLIADHLWIFCGRKLKLWHMGQEEYLGAVRTGGRRVNRDSCCQTGTGDVRKKSGVTARTAEPLSDRRLHMLDHLENEELKQTAALMRQYRIAVYQERLVACAREMRV